MINYKWSSAGFSADATEVGREIEKLEDITGKVDKRDIIKYAEKNVDSELYKCFDWDNESAGEKYRMIQASQILSSLKIVIKEEDNKNNEEVVRAYVVVKEENEEKTCIKNISRVIENDNEYNQLKEKAYKELESCKEKYQNLIELSDLKDIIFDLYKTI